MATRISKNIDLRDGSSCELIYEEQEGWLRATWLGYVDPEEAYQGATNFLRAMRDWHCPYLLNDNSGLQGPWFDSIEWLTRVWAPQAEALGLRCIAHVVQPHDALSQAAVLADRPFGPNLRLQLFDDVPSAVEWLRRRIQAA